MVFRAATEVSNIIDYPLTEQPILIFSTVAVFPIKFITILIETENLENQEMLLGTVI